MQTAERSSGHDPSESVIYNRCLFAYEEASRRVKGAVIELGSGEGYGMRLLSPLASNYLAIDKFEPQIPAGENIEFQRQVLPAIDGVENDSFDFAVTFQVVEHIKNDVEFIRQIHRVLKPGGSLLLSTPNKLMSLTRNPWHIREYTMQELSALLKKFFSFVEIYGVYGNDTINAYHERNRAAVSKITRYDILNLQYRLPRQVLRIPYDIMNRLNRRKLLKRNPNLVAQVSTKDFSLRTADDACYDLFAVARK